MKKILLFSLLLIGINTYGQYLYPVKVENCKIDRFCLDCGDTLAGYDQKAFTKLEQELNKELDLNKLTGRIGFQVLVAPNKTGCVISHTDESNSTVTKKIIEKLNKFKKWTPSITDGKIDLKTSINVVFEIQNNTISGEIVRVDFAEFEKSFDYPTDPEILNNTYQYKNESLSNYTISVWDTKNSNLHNNNIMKIAVDKSELVWVISSFELLTFNGKDFKKMQYNDSLNDPGYHRILIDTNDIVWLNQDREIYSIKNHKWQKHPLNLSYNNSVYNITENPKKQEILVSFEGGLAIYNNQRWDFLHQEILKKLPSNRINFTQRDSNNKLWISTFNGSVVLNKNNELVKLEHLTSLLKNKYINSMDEDQNGNLYFLFGEFDMKKDMQGQSGVIIYYLNNTFTQFSIENSGIATDNSFSKLLYDKEDDILWIATYNAGLIRYDLKKNTWENYHSKNSMLPTSKITDMAFDKNYNLYLATDQGLVKLEKR